MFLHSAGKGLLTPWVWVLMNSAKSALRHIETLVQLLKNGPVEGVAIVINAVTGLVIVLQFLCTVKRRKTIMEI